MTNEIRVSQNKAHRTFTIRTPFAKYRTYKMDKQEFASAYYWTINDWNQFLKTDEYFKVK